jgi:hypothetical protein
VEEEREEIELVENEVPFHQHFVQFPSFRLVQNFILKLFLIHSSFKTQIFNNSLAYLALPQEEHLSPWCSQRDHLLPQPQLVSDGLCFRQSDRVTTMRLL